MNTVSRRDYSRYPYRMVEWMHENFLFHLNYATIFFFLDRISAVVYF